MRDSRACFAAALLAASLLAASLIVLAGCSRGSNTVVDPTGGAREETSTLTPLERGKVRREILHEVDKWIAGWMASDVDAMSEVATDTVVAEFEKVWSDYAKKGQRVVHVHTRKYLDVIDLAKDGHQALVTYRYDDDSYVANAAGTRVETLPPFKDKEIQLTVDRQDDGSWLIVRIIAGENAYR